MLYFVDCNSLIRGENSQLLIILYLVLQTTFKNEESMLGVQEMKVFRANLLAKGYSIPITYVDSVLFHPLNLLKFNNFSHFQASFKLNDGTQLPMIGLW